ncbi:MAG: hypothetical protein ACTHW1_07420 [Ancrocorticia sp.]|uniref:hypothetical protein n=1 Tax=Ancrocorticia sp. TaxID=2593684 RepID=UPI003F9372EA
MFPQYGTLKDIVPIIEMLSRLPGRLMARSLAVVSLIVAGLGWVIGQRGGGFIDWLPFTCGVIGFIVSLFFTWRRHRLEQAVTSWAQNMESTVSGEGSTSSTQEVTVIGEDGTPLGGNFPATPAEDSAAQRNHDAMMEHAQRRDTWMPRVEAAQRAAVAAAGGTVNAPYLKDDLRITLSAAIAAGVLIPIETLMAFIAFFAIL